MPNQERWIRFPADRVQTRRIHRRARDSEPGVLALLREIIEFLNRIPTGLHAGPEGLLGGGEFRVDLDETLVHSTFQPEESADIVLPITIEDALYRVYVQVRPFAKEFLQEMSKHFELVLFTASLQKYADPLLDLLDKSRVIRTF